MTKKITLSIPDELGEKMEKWKNSFNYSKLFQDTISKEIQKKEDFNKRLKEDSEMEQIIERLRKEKREVSINHYEQGKLDGVEWAKASSYDEIMYALNWQTMVEMNENLLSYDPTKDEILGDYFNYILNNEDDPNITCINTKGHNYIPNDNFAHWERGWKDGVKAFWDEVKNKLQ